MVERIEISAFFLEGAGHGLLRRHLRQKPVIDRRSQPVFKGVPALPPFLSVEINLLGNGRRRLGESGAWIVRSKGGKLARLSRQQKGSLQALELDVIIQHA